MDNGIKAVIFDLYNTLVYVTDERRPYSRLFNELSLKSSEKRKAKRIILTEDFSNIFRFVEKVKPNSSISLKPYKDDIAREVNSVRDYPDTKMVLKKLKEREIKIGLISNLSSPYKKPFFDLGLHSYFDRVFFSCEIGLKKPDKRVYQNMIKELGIESSQALMVGDRLELDIYPAMSIGMRALHLGRTNEGFDHPDITSLEEIFQYC